MFVTRDDQTFDRGGIMLLDRRGHGGGGLAGADDDHAALGRRDFRQIGRQAKRRMRRAHGGVEHFAKEFAVVVGHGDFYALFQSRRTTGRDSFSREREKDCARRLRLLYDPAITLAFSISASAMRIEAMSIRRPSSDTAPLPSLAAWAIASRMRRALVTSASEGVNT